MLRGYVCSSACLSHILSAKIVGQILLEFNMGDLLLIAFVSFQFSAILTYSELHFNWGHKLILLTV
jgi:hypothetical protein